MSLNALREAGGEAGKTAAGLCWAQWVGLGSLAVPVRTHRPRSIIDPEALVLLSLYVSHEERRLRDMVAWWARKGSSVTSLQRLKTVARRFPEAVASEGLPLFAALANEAGDRRWRRSAQGTVPDWFRSGKGPESLELIEPNALWPRLRAGFGVGAKADLLAFLLGLRGAWASTKVISFATGYSTVAVRNAANEMTLARLIRETHGRPAEYLAPPGPWAALLELHAGRQESTSNPEMPEWRFWSEIFGFLAHVIALSRTARSAASSSERVIASRARDLLEDHAMAFKFNNIRVPPPEMFKGRAATRGLLGTVQAVSAWSNESL